MIADTNYEELELRIAALVSDDTLRDRLFEDKVNTDRHLVTAINRTCPKSTSLVAYSPEMSDYAKKHADKLAAFEELYYPKWPKRKKTKLAGTEWLKPFGPSRYVP